MRINIKLKKVKKGRRQEKWAMDKLKTNEEALRKSIEERVTCEPGATVEKRWKGLKEAVIESAKVHIGFRKGREAKKPWITQEMLEKMEERRKWKSRNTVYGNKIYRQLNNELRRETQKAKGKWWDREYSELEELDARGRSDLVYAKVKKLSAKINVSSKSTTIKDDTGKLLTLMTLWSCEKVERVY